MRRSQRFNAHRSNCPFALGVEARSPGVQIGKVEARVEIDLTHPVGNQALTELD
jgi:hypothetical protein